MNKLKNLSFAGKCMLGAAITAVVLFVLSVTLTVFVDPFSTTYAAEKGVNYAAEQENQQH